MRWLKTNIERISKLKAEGSPESLTYAALECRLAIERVCYERLSLAHDYISHDDIRKWQPKDVVNTLIQEVDSRITASYTFSISKEPISKEGDLTKEEYEAIEYVEIGTHVGFDPKKMGKLWNAVSHFLHVKVPKQKHESVTEYGEPDTLAKKIDEVLVELERLSEGTLIAGGLGETVKFKCECGAENKRRVSLLKEGQTVSCINPICLESWSVRVEGDEISFMRKEISVPCRSCLVESTFPEKAIFNLKLDQTGSFTCRECNKTNFFKWKMYSAAKNDA
ncbi:hypothetical protein [Stappia indica]|uniref:hypothetical protein n=1 Tax=Stappia indica TaxID=538381 RepID=UPI001D194D64|nr:hypothetical protein [Stappia indica]MCC4245305.1 hypothetical protein [Stappia indica]